MSIKEFLVIYFAEFCQTQSMNKPCYEAYLNSEAKHFEIHGKNKFKSYNTFKSSKSQHIRINTKNKRQKNQ